MNKKVIYTSIFGSEYYLHEPSVKLNGWDYICFTDNPAPIGGFLFCFIGM